MHGRLSVKITAALLLCLLSFVCLVGCQDDSGSGQQEQAAGSTGALPSSAPVASESETAAVPGIKVGKLFLPLPAPEGFTRLEEEGRCLESLRAGLGKKQVLLAAFARPHDSSAGVLLNDGPEQYDILQVTTLEHWQYTNFSAAGFDAVKAAWQEDSVTCSQKVLLHLEEAAAGSLADFPAYTYRLGLAGYSPGLISFASVLKSPGPEGEAVFVCAIRSLIYRQGKILGLEYRQRLDNFAEIAPTVDEHLDYLEELQTLDGSAQDGPARPSLNQTTRFIPDGKPALSAVSRP